MKLNDLIQSFSIHMNNEEKSLYDTIDCPKYITQFSEREKLIIEALTRKSLLSKVQYKNAVLVIKND